MTGLHRAVRRVTNELHHSGRPLVIELEVGGKFIRIREKGRRSSYTVTYHAIYVMGARGRAAEIKAEKIARRKAKQKAAR